MCVMAKRSAAAIAVPAIALSAIPVNMRASDGSDMHWMPMRAEATRTVA